MWAGLQITVKRFLYGGRVVPKSVFLQERGKAISTFIPMALKKLRIVDRGGEGEGAILNAQPRQNQHRAVQIRHEP